MSICKVPGCTDRGQHTGNYKNGMPVYRDKCAFHHNQDLGKVSDKKSYCENVDGRLGFICSTKIHNRTQLDIDHIDGVKSNNDRDNLQTLCACCHRMKTLLERHSFWDSYNCRATMPLSEMKLPTGNIIDGTPPDIRIRKIPKAAEVGVLAFSAPKKRLVLSATIGESNGTDNTSSK